MSSPASVAKHPIHPMLVVFPIGLWVFSLVADIIFLAGGNLIWRDVALRAMAGGIIGALAAAIPGFIDFMTLTGRAKNIAAYHMALNLSLVVLFAINFWLRIGGATYIGLSIIGIIGLVVSGWLGGELVYVNGIAVEPQAVTVKAEEESFEDEYWAAYTYIADKLRDRRYQGKEWSQVEADFHQDWEKDHPGSWDRFRNTIHRGWDARH